MTDKHRHRHAHAPHGSLPNWVLVAFAAGTVALLALVRNIGG